MEIISIISTCPINFIATEWTWKERFYRKCDSEIIDIRWLNCRHIVLAPPKYTVYITHIRCVLMTQWAMLGDTQVISSDIKWYIDIRNIGNESNSSN